MKVEEILEEMENILLESGRVPFTNKRLVEEDDMARLIDELRDAMPSQLVEAGRIVSDRQRILEEAQQKSDEIIQQAKAYHSKLTDENLITRQAQEQANEIVTNARKESEQTLREAEEKAAEDGAKEAQSGADSSAATSHGYGGRGGYSGGRGGAGTPTQVGQLGSASMGHSGGSGVSATWGAPRGDFSPYKSQDKGSEIPTTQLKNQDAKRALAQFAQTSRAAAG